MYKIARPTLIIQSVTPIRIAANPFDDDKGYCKYFIPPLSPATQLSQCQKVAGSINKVY